MAAIAMPMVNQTIRSQEAASFRIDILRTFRRAKELAVSQNQKHVITWTGGGFSIQSETEPVDEAAAPGMASNIEQDPAEVDPNRVSISTLNPPQDVTIDQFWLDDEIIESAGWEAAFYPNGTAERVGLEYSVAGRQFWIRVDNVRGGVEMGEGPYPADQLQRWEAGELEQRISQ